MAVNQFTIATVRGLIPCSEYRLSLFSALGVEKTDFEAASLDFRTMSFDGVLGKDFFRDRVLTIDFRNGTIDLQ